MTMTEPSVELVRAAPGMAPMSVDEAKQQMQTYREMCGALLDRDDMQAVGDREFVKRSGFQKLAAAYGVSTTIVKLDIEREAYGEDGDAIMVARAVVRATHPSGRFAEGDGHCASSEKRFHRGAEKIEHDLPATAVTRATNRAVSNLVAYGSVSAEEAEMGGTSGAHSGTGQGQLPEWAAPMTDIPGVAQNLVRVLQATGVDEPGKKAMAIGEEVFNLCGESFPFALARLAKLLADAAEQGGTPDKYAKIAKAGGMPVPEGEPEPEDAETVHPDAAEQKHPDVEAVVEDEKDAANRQTAPDHEPEMAPGVDERLAAAPSVALPTFIDANHINE